jgi:hypothetical protein
MTFNLTTAISRPRISGQPSGVRAVTSTITHFRFPAETEYRRVYVRKIGRSFLCEHRSQLMPRPIGARAPC